MPILRAFEEQAIVPEIRNFALTEAKLAECNVQTDGIFDSCFLNQKEPLLASIALQLYWLDREVPADEVRGALGGKLCVRPAHCHYLMKKQPKGQDGWLPTHNEDQLLILFMKDKTGAIREVEVVYLSQEPAWRTDIATDSDEFPVGTIIIAQANAL